jgi:hypothetical protein
LATADLENLIAELTQERSKIMVRGHITIDENRKWHISYYGDMEDSPFDGLKELIEANATECEFMGNAAASFLAQVISSSQSQP